MIHRYSVPSVAGWLALAVLAQTLEAATAIPAEKANVISLDGAWRFLLEQAGDRPEHGSIGGGPRPIVQPKQPIPFQEMTYREDNAWHNLTVPGNWEIAGDSPATYNQPDNAIGLYRLSFDVPAGWRGRIVKLNFDGIQNGAEVFCNGQPVNVDEPSWGRPNYHEGGFDAFQADLTPVVRCGDKNLLAIRVTKNTKSVDLDTGDFFFLGGIHRTVTLFSVPRAHVDDLTVQTRLLPAGKAELRVVLSIASASAGLHGVMQLEGQSPVEASARQAGRVELVQILDHPKLWSAEHPNLYALEIDLKDAQGRAIEHLTKRVGVREVSIKDGVLRVNGVPVKLTGMCRHEVYPTLGSALNDQIWRQDITLMKAANVNAIRTSHYPYGSGFYDLCDELGMYVADEMAACWCPTNSDELAPAFAQHARELVRRDRNHPCVILWAVGNENKPGKNNKVAADEIRKLDTTRPRLVSWRNAEQADVEIDDAHYTNPAEVARANREVERRKKFPKTYLENPNDWEARNGADFGCLDLWAAVIDRTWREVWEDEHIPGAFLWEWQDRAVADKCPTKLYDYDATTGISLVKVKGICDGYRNPRAWYYHVKMAYAPVKLDLHARADHPDVKLEAINYYSFTDLAELRTTWSLLKAGKTLQSAAVHLSLAPRTRGELTLELPADALAQADALRLDFDHPDGHNVATYQLRLAPEPDSRPQVTPGQLGALTFPNLNLVPVTYAPNRIGWHWASRHPGRLINISVQKPSGPLDSSALVDDATLYATPLTAVRAMDADIVLSDDPTSRIVGHVRTDFVEGHFSYRVNWTGEKADIQELGWSFHLPTAADHFSWHRRAYWSWYPPTHIGRSAGVATPDSAEADITRTDRPDAFDFNATKYNCDWASLADTGGHGLVVSFPQSPHHCRGGNTPGGGHALVVNRYCCPPRDISSGVVPDFYFTLERGGQTSGEFELGSR